jgi:hypothetical protein
MFFSFSNAFLYLSYYCVGTETYIQIWNYVFQFFKRVSVSVIHNHTIISPSPRHMPPTKKPKISKNELIKSIFTPYIEHSKYMDVVDENDNEVPGKFSLKSTMKTVGSIFNLDSVGSHRDPDRLFKFLQDMVTFLKRIVTIENLLRSLHPKSHSGVSYFVLQ